MPVATYIVNRSTSLIQIDSSITPNAIVWLSSVNTPGSLITIRDIAGQTNYYGAGATSNNVITVSTMDGIKFIHRDFTDPNFLYNSSIQISQPYGFVTVTPKTSNIWAVINTQSFPNVTTAANLVNLTVDTSFLREASISTCRISTLAANNISTMSLSAVSSIIQSTLYVPFIYNSSLQTSSILTSSLSASNITSSNVYAVSTTLASSAYIPFIYNSSLQTSSILTSTLSASNITASNVYAVSTTLASSAYVPFIYNSSLQTSSILTSSLFANNISTMSLSAVSSIIQSNLYVPFIYNSSLRTSSIIASTLSVFTEDVRGSLNISGSNVAIRIWITVGDGPNPILYSTDEQTWTPVISISADVTSVNRVCWNGSNRWVAVGKASSVANTILYSDDGLTWNPTTLPAGTTGFTTGSTGGGYGIAYNGTDKWVAVGKSATGINTILWSSDGITWNSTAGATGFSTGSTGGGYGIAYAQSTWIAVGKGTNNILRSTDNGITWIAPFFIPSATSYNDIVYGENKWIAVGYSASPSNTIITSTNSGQSWAGVSVGGFAAGGGGNGITWNGSYFVAVGSNPGNTAGTIQYSLDGTKWYNSVTGSFSIAGYGITWSENYFTAVGSDSSHTILYSYDGKNWEYEGIAANSLTTGRGVCYSRGSIGPLYALSITGDTYINGNLYINGIPTITYGFGSGSSGSSGNAAAPAAALPVYVTNVSSMLGQFSSIGVGVKDPAYQIDVGGSINASSNIYINGDSVLKENSLYSTVQGLGSIGYISSLSLQSTIQGLGSIGYISSLSLQSTIQGLGSIGYISSLSLQSTVKSFNTNCSSLQGTFSSIGVNCNSPMYRLDVNGDINYTGSLLKNGATVGTIPGINSLGNVSINSPTPSLIPLTVAGQVGITGDLNINGNIGINNASPSYSLNLTVLVTTLAGSGSIGSVDLTGTAASFYYPYSVAVDSAGNLYVADSWNHKIRKITSGGVVTTLAGSGSAGSVNNTGTAASFYYPTGVAVDSAGNVYVADFNNNKIRKITSGGVVTTLAGSGSAAFSDGQGAEAGFNLPSGVAVDSAGNVYVADSSNGRIRKITSGGVVTTLAGSGGTGSGDGTGAEASFYLPSGVAVDSAGNVYVADKNNNRIRKITPVGVVTTLAGSGNAAFADATGAVASFNNPTGVAVDSAGNLYVADQKNHKIRKITSGGVVTTIAGSGNAVFADGTGTGASFNNPYGVAVDSAGNLYVCDQSNNRIRKLVIINPSCELSLDGSIYASKNITAGGSVTSLSDARTKTNVLTINHPLEKIMKMRGVYYNRIDDGDAEPKRHVGVIAQEVEEALPEVVLTDTSENKNKSVAYGNIVALLIEAVKAQQSTIDSLLNKS